MIGKSLRQAESDVESSIGWTERLLGRLGLVGNGAAGFRPNAQGLDEANLPSLITVLTTSINIMQVRIARSRLAGEPADVLISPRMGHLGPMDFHRAREAIAEGEAAVARMLPALRYMLGKD
jgi:NTE family protein